MKLYGAKLSPFAARIRAAAYFKGIGDQIELAYPPAALDSAEWKAINPLGKIPALETNNRILIESEVILEYLEDRFPATPLLPANLEDRALVRTINRVCDLYVFAPFQSLFRELRQPEPNMALIEAQKPRILEGLAFLDKLLPASESPYVLGDKPTLADCTVATTLFLIDKYMQRVDIPAVLEPYERVSNYWNRCKKDPVIERVHGQMMVGYESFLTTGRPT